jgi:hypothetical protein
MCALSPEKDGATRMKSLGLYRPTEELIPLREWVAEVNRESWIAESSQWREREELGIESSPWELYETPDTTLNFGSSPAKPKTANRASRLADLLRAVAIFVACGAFFVLPTVIPVFASRPLTRTRTTPIW